MKTEFVYVGIRVKDLQKSIDFYTKLLGMRVVGRHKFEKTGGEIVNLRGEKGGFMLELNHYERDSPFNTPYVLGEELDHLAFRVDDLDEALEEARSSGYPSVLEIESDNTRWAYIEDPNGIWVELYSKGI